MPPTDAKGEFFRPLGNLTSPLLGTDFVINLLLRDLRVLRGVDIFTVDPEQPQKPNAEPYITSSYDVGTVASPGRVAQVPQKVR